MTDDARYAALCARDRRFDGVFFVGVGSTGIYCRPICPARTPARRRCEFFGSAVQADLAGYRACLRCRPELAPGHADVDAVDQLVAAAARRIAEGALNDASVDDLADELGVSGRHLRRSLEARLGASPIALAQSRRLALAKQLLQDTALPLAQIAFAAGFGSIRRFNAAFATAFGRAPSALRRGLDRATAAGLVLRLDYREPFDWAHLLGFLAGRAIPGVEQVTDDSYRRVVGIGEATGTIEVRRDPTRPALQLTVAPSLTGVLMPLVARVRRLFDLDARPDLIADVLGRDPVLARSVAARPGLRVPGAIDGFEAAVRALLGQQVSVAAATTLAGRFAMRFGTRIGDGALALRFPSADDVARSTPEAIAQIGLPLARATALHGFADAIARGALRLDGVHDLERFVVDATALRGIGPWTAHYLAMRALHLPDAFPAADLGVKKALALPPRAAERHAEAWRPFRAYAVMHLWTSLGDTDADDDRRLAARTARAVRPGPRAGRAVPAGDAVAARRPRRGGAPRDARADARRRAARRVLRG